MSGMRCTKCPGDTHVIDCRVNKNERHFRRRRKCEKCGHRFTTLERPIGDEYTNLLEKHLRVISRISLRAFRILPDEGWTSKEPNEESTDKKQES
jgi:hypothetical protein